MKHLPPATIFLEQSEDLIWIIDFNFKLIYANKSYLAFMKDITNTEKAVNDSVFIDSIDKTENDKWRDYYERALKGEHLEIEESYHHSKSNDIKYCQITFTPITEENGKITTVACQSKDITDLAKQRSEANQLMDASLDVFCTIDEAGNFVHVNAAAVRLWGYTPKELRGVPYINLVMEEDIPKTMLIANAILNGEEVRSFDNRYVKKDGRLAYNLWSVRWDETSKLMFAVARDGREKLEQERKIIESEQRFKALVQEGSDLYAIIDTKGYYTYMSPSSLAITGIPPETFIGRDAFEFIHPDDYQQTLDYLKKITIEEKIVMAPYRAKNNKNEWRWVETVLTNMLGNPAVNGIIVNSSDITEKIEQENKILQSEQRFKALVQEGSDLIAILDADGLYTYVSPTSISVLNMAPNEFIGRNALDFIHPDDLEKAKSSLQLIANEKKVYLEPFRFQIHENEWRWIETVLTNMIENPSVNGIVANSRDVTDKIKEEQKLRLFESVVTNTSDAILITEAEPQDPPGPKIIFANEAFTKMTGYQPEEVIGKTPRILQGPNSDRKALAKLGQSLRNWEPYELTTVNYKKNGEEFWINFTVTPVPNDQGIYTHWIAIERDVTEQKVKEIENELITKISDIFHRRIDNDLTECLTNLCEHITKFGDFDLAEIWLPAIDAKVINRVAKYVDGKAGSAFYKATKHVKSCALGEGMPGHIWEHKKTEVWSNVEGEWLASRKSAALKAGIVAMMGVPLKDKDDVIGVLLLGTEKTKSSLTLYSELLQKLETTIGMELSRKKIEIELSQIFNFTPDMILLAGFDGYIKRINPAGLELLGYSLEEMRSNPIQSFIHEQDRRHTEEKLQGLHEGKDVKNFENRYITKEGETLWLSWTATASQEHRTIYAVAKNITEEKKLRELNRQAGSLAKIGSWEINMANKTMFWSEKVHQIHETDPDSYEPTIEKTKNFYRKDFHQLVQETLENCVNSGEPFDLEVVIITAKQNETWVRVIGEAQFLNGKCTKVYGSFQDIHERKIAVLELEKSLKTLKDYKFSLDQSAIIAFTDKKGIITSVNDNFCDVSEYDRSDIIGKTHRLINSDYHSKEFFKELWSTIASGAVWRGEIQNKTKSGSYYWVDTTIVPFLGDDNKPIQYLAIRFDITLRKVAEVEKNILQRTLEKSLNEIYTFDAETFLFNYSNEGALSNLQYSEEEIKSLTPLDIKPDYTLAAFKKLVRPLLTNEQKKIIFFTTYQRKDKSLYPVEVHLQLVAESHNKRFLAIVLDITDRKKAEERILLSNERFEKVTEATNDAIWDWDISKQTFYRSKAIERFFGENTLKLMDEKDFWKDKFYSEDLTAIQNSLSKALSDPTTDRWEAEYRIINEDGKKVYVIDRGIIIRDQKGTAIRMVGSMTDISEQKHLTIQLSHTNETLQQRTVDLERSNEVLEQFAFVASHDLQEPLRMISSFMDLLQRKYGDQLDDKGLQYIHFATDGAKRMKQIILDLLDYSRATRPTEGKEKVDLAEIISEFKQLRRKVISERHAIITTDQLPIINTYKAAATQIFHCILDNALKYVEAGKQPIVELKIVEHETEWEFAIKDNGIGIEPQFYEKIFIIFQRLHNKDQYTGTGIGLSIAKRHVEFLGGSIWVRSNTGEGTIFYFTIPKI